MVTNAFSTRSSRHSAQQTLPKTGMFQKKKKPRKKKKRILLKIFLIGLLLAFLAFLGGLWLFWSYASDSPKLDDRNLHDTVSSKLLDVNGEVFEDLGAEKREIIEPTEIPQLLKDAVISVEDKRFYDHWGVDPVRIIGSFFSNIKTGGLQGGSTLTQQLIKLSFFSTKKSDQTLKRKAQEAWMAVQLERKKSKEEILTYYINKVYMANGLYGMETAAKTYFGKPLSELSLPQAALIAGMPQAPNDYDPYVHPELAKERRDVVLYTMLENKKITKNEYEKAKATPVTEGLQEPSQDSSERKIVDNYIKEVIAEVEEKTGKNVYTDGLEIHTNLDMAMQKQLYAIINTDQFVQYPDPDFQVASTVIDVKTGQVKAQIGGRNIPDDVQLGGNLAVNTRRDVGSTIKPLIDYAPAIEYLNYSTGKILYDRATTYSGTNTHIYNADMQYYGAITMRRAIMYSRNTTAVQTFQTVGVDKAKAFINSLDIDFKDLVESNAISSNTAQDGTKYGISSLKLAAAYASFANNGIYNKPYYVHKITYQDGSVDDFVPDSKRVMKESTAYLMTDMLKDVIIGGTAFNAGIPNLIQAGKTGTSNYTDEDLKNMGTSQHNIAPDSTFVGYTKHYTVSVWTGYNNRLVPIPYEYWSTASDVYREMMSYISQNMPNDDWAQPENVTRIGKELYVTDSTTPSVVTPPATTPSYVAPPVSSVPVIPESSYEEPIYSEEPDTEVPPSETPESSEEQPLPEEPDVSSEVPPESSSDPSDNIQNSEGSDPPSTG